MEKELQLPEQTPEKKPKKKMGKAIIGFLIRLVIYAAIFVGMVVVGTQIKEQYFTVKEVEVIDVNLLESSVKSIGELATLEYQYRDTLDLSSGWLFTSCKAIISYDSVIKAGVDVDSLEVEPVVNEEGVLESVHIKVPDARVLSHEVSNQKTIYEEGNFYSSISSKKRTNQLEKSKLEHRLQFAIDGNIATAYDRATDAIEDLIHNIYGSSVKVTFEKVPTDSSKLNEEEKLLRLIEEYPQLENEDNAELTMISDEMINFFYDHYYGNSFEDVMSMYVDEYAPTDIKNELSNINYAFGDTGLELKPLWLFNSQDGGNENYLYYKLYYGDEDLDLVYAMVYDVDTNTQVATFMELESGNGVSTEALYLYFASFSCYTDEIYAKCETDKEIDDQTIKLINSLIDAAKKGNDMVFGSYSFFYYQDDGEFIAIVPK